MCLHSGNKPESEKSSIRSATKEANMTRNILSMVVARWRIGDLVCGSGFSSVY